MIAFADFYWGDVILILLVIIVTNVLTFLITRSRHPAQSTTVKALARALARAQLAEEQFAREIHRNRELAAVMKKSALRDQRIADHNDSIAELYRLRSSDEFDVAFMMTRDVVEKGIGKGVQ